MTKDEALRLALEALTDALNKPMWNRVQMEAAITAIKAALEAKDEPVAWQYRDANDDGTWGAWTGCDKRLTESDWRKVRPLYTTPPKKEAKDEPDQYAMDIECTKCGAKQSGVLTVHTTPPQRKPLSDEQIMEALGLDGYESMAIENARAIEAAHGIKGEA